MEQQTGRLMEELKRRLRGGKGRRLLLVVGFAGIALLALSEWIPTETADTKTSLSAEAYVQQTEERLCDIVSQIEGAGRCEVMVTLENGVEYIYATEQRNSSDRREDTDDGASRLTQSDGSESSVIVVDGDSGRSGLLVTELQPTVRGVVIVCEGGDREEVRSRIVEAVTVAMNLSAKRVCVTKLS